MVKTNQYEGHPENTPDQNNNLKIEILKRQDFFIWQSTVENYVALRDPLDGSPFIKALVTAFSNCAHKFDIFEIFIEVNNLMREHVSVSISTLYSVATRHFYFNY